MWLLGFPQHQLWSCFGGWWEPDRTSSPRSLGGAAVREVSLLNGYLLICFLFLLGYSKAQKQLSTRVELKALWASMTAQWVHLITLGQCPEPTGWEERTDSHKLSFDLYLCAVAMPHTINTFNKNNKTSEEKLHKNKNILFWATGKRGEGMKCRKVINKSCLISQF